MRVRADSTQPPSGQLQPPNEAIGASLPLSNFTMEALGAEAQKRVDEALHRMQDVDLHDPKVVGLLLALSSSAFIGASFVVTRMALQRSSARGVTAPRDGGYGYMREPLWWCGTTAMFVGEVANFSAYAFAPAILVTPLGALSIIVSALLADCMLGERLHACGLVGCASCVVGSVVLVSFAPEEQPLHSVDEIWALATQPLFVAYTLGVGAAVGALVGFCARRWGESNVLVYIAICSLMGSLSVVSCKALGIALKLTFKGYNQLGKSPTYVFVGAVAVCVATQMNYLNKALDTFNTALVSSVYYVFFTVSVITASTIMYKDWERNTAEMISGQLFGFLLIVGGVWSLNATRDGAAAFADFARGVRAAAGALLAEWPPWTRRKELERRGGRFEPVGAEAAGSDDDEEAEAGRRRGRDDGDDGAGALRRQGAPAAAANGVEIG